MPGFMASGQAGTSLLASNYRAKVRLRLLVAAIIMTKLKLWRLVPHATCWTSRGSNLVYGSRTRTLALSFVLYRSDRVSTIYENWWESSTRTVYIRAIHSTVARQRSSCCSKARSACFLIASWHHGPRKRLQLRSSEQHQLCDMAHLHGGTAHSEGLFQ